MILVEYQCERCGRFEALVQRPARSEAPCLSCDATAERVISAVSLKQQLASVDRGKPEEPPPGAVTTRELADGMPMQQWHEKRRRKRRDRREQQLRDLGVVS